MAYTRVNWQDTPSVMTPISAANLNIMDAGVAANDTAIAGISTNRKLDETGNFTGTLNGMPIVQDQTGLATTVAGHTAQLDDIAQQYKLDPSNKYDKISFLNGQTNNQAYLLYMFLIDTTKIQSGDLFYVDFDYYTENQNIRGINSQIFGNNNANILTYTGGQIDQGDVVTNAGSVSIGNYTSYHRNHAVANNLYQYVRICITITQFNKLADNIFLRNVKLTVGAQIYTVPVGKSISLLGTSGTILESQYLDQASTFLNKRKSKWYGKRWNVIGDSITEHNTRTVKNYQDYINDILQGTINNYGQSGTGYVAIYASYVAIPNRIDVMDSTADLVTVFAGANDFDHGNVPLGALGDTTTATIMGGIDLTLSTLINKYPTKTIAVFTPLPQSNNWGSSAIPNAQSYTLEQLANAIIAVCKKYNIPCLDLYHNSNFYIWNTTVQTYYFTDLSSATTIHPNDAGHQVLAAKILAFLNTL